MQLLLYVEEMQTQQRAENGIRENVIGYVGRDDWEPDTQELDPGEIAALGPAYEATLSELPEDIRDIYLAEQHRLQTGEVVSVEQFKRQKEVISNS